MKRSKPFQTLTLLLGAIIIVALTARVFAAQGQTADTTGLDQLYEEVYTEDAPVRNAVYLYLRVAGAVWIAVEWTAAIVLGFAYRDLKRAWALPPTDPLTDP